METKPDLNDLQILCAVVDRGSFRAAADYVGTSQPTVSRAITRLEDRIGQALVRRNSRSVSPTELGRQYAELARRLLREFDDVEAELLGGDELAGPISLSAPPALGRRLLAAALAEFCQEHPSLRLNISLENRRVDLLEERVDIAIRFGPLEPTWRRQRLLLRGKYHLYGSAAHAELAQLPVSEVIEHARCLVLHSTHLRDRWPFATDGGQTWHVVQPALKCNDVGSLIALATLGTGITLLPDFLVRDEVKRGDLVRLTASHDAVPAEVFAMTTEGRHSRPVEALLRHLTTSLLDAAEE